MKLIINHMNFKFLDINQLKKLLKKLKELANYII